MLRAVTLVLVLCASPAWAANTIYYVAKAGDGGSNSNSCAQSTSIGTPKLTIAAGLACLAADSTPGDDTLLIRTGTYVENITSITNGTSWSSKTRIANYNSSTAQGGCSSLAAHTGVSEEGTCGTTGELVTIQPSSGAAVSVNGANHRYIEFDGINFDGTTSIATVFSMAYDGTGNPDHVRVKNGKVNISTTGICYLCGPWGITISGDFHEIQNMTFRGGGYQVGGGAGGCPDAHPTDSCQGYAVYFAVNDSLIEYCDIAEGTDYGIHAYSSVGVYRNIIRNNVIHDITIGYGFLAGILVAGPYNLVYNNIIYNIDNQNDGTAGGLNGNGIQVNGWFNNEFYHNTIVDVTSAGIRFVGDTGQSTIKNNIVWDHGGEAINRQTVVTPLTCDHNVLSAVGAGISCSSTVTSDPLFSNEAGRDYRLASSGSPAYDTGTSLGTGCTEPGTIASPCYKNDINAVVRPQGGGWDIGAYEFITPDPSTPTGFSPVDGATGVSTSPTLSWSSATNATSYDVYFGTYTGVGSAAFSDAFTRANSGTLGASWTAVTSALYTGAWGVGSNAATLQSFGANTESVATQAMENNQWVQYTLSTYVQSSGCLAAMGILRGSSSAGNHSGYFAGPANFGAGYTTLIQRNNSSGTGTTLASDNSITWAATDIVRVTIVGKVITVYRNGVAVLSATDSDTVNYIASGKSGLYGIACGGALTDVVVDTWSQGNMGPLYVQNQAGLTYAPSTLSTSTTYYWKIASRNATTFTDAAIISFTTSDPAPSCASGLTPANAATDVSITPTLSWSSVSGATKYDVYFDSGAGTTLVSNDQVGLTYAPGTLSNSTTYSWKIVPGNASGDATGCTAISFTTLAGSPPASGTGTANPRLRKG